MRRVMAGFGVVAILVFTANAVQASAFAYCDPDNLSNCGADFPGSPPGPSQGPYVTSGGAVWIKTGSADPVAVDSDVNLEFMYSTGANGAFADLVSLNDQVSPAVLLLSDHTADNWFLAHQSEDPAHSVYYPGYWGIFAAPDTDHQAWGIPGTDASGWYYTKVRAWTGNFDSYAAAVSGGAAFAETAAFTTHFAYMIDPFVGEFDNMPAMILRQYLGGDANQDGKVDINDLSMVLTDYDKTGMTWTQGDFNGDRKCDINDLSLVLTNYDRSLGASAAAAPAPEPSAFVLLAASLPAAGWLLGRRRRSRNS